MDKAFAMKRMRDAGIPMIDIRTAFATVGGRKGQKIQEASNAHVNMIMSFLDFPKAIQNKIHDGIIPIWAAHQLA
jgi:hypothetical protein